MPTGLIRSKLSFSIEPLGTLSKLLKRGEPACSRMTPSTMRFIETASVYTSESPAVATSSKTGTTSLFVTITVKQGRFRVPLPDSSTPTSPSAPLTQMTDLITPLTLPPPSTLLIPRMQIALHKGSGWISRLIQWQTRSPYSHASILTGFGDVFEAREFQGVLKTARRNWRLPAGESVDIFGVEINGNRRQRERQIIRFLHRQLDKPYDYRMVLRFISRRSQDRRTVGKWFCSELVYAAFQKAGINLLARTEPWEVSPGLLARSPLLTYITTLYSSKDSVDTLLSDLIQQPHHNED